MHTGIYRICDTPGLTSKVSPANKTAGANEIVDSAHGKYIPYIQWRALRSKYSISLTLPSCLVVFWRLFLKLYTVYRLRRATYINMCLLLNHHQKLFSTVWLSSVKLWNLCFWSTYFFYRFRSLHFLVLLNRFLADFYICIQYLQIRDLN